MLVSVLLLVSTGLFAATVNFIKVEAIIVKPQRPVEVLPYAINLESYPGPLKKKVVRYSVNIKSNLIYLVKVTVDKKLYYRLVAGNFKNRQQAGLALSRIKKYYPGAWINSRVGKERRQLARLLSPDNKKPPVQKTVVAKTALQGNSSTDSASVAKFLDRARQEFLDGNYTRVLAIANKIIETGSTEQIQKAMELAGIAHERQNKFTLAIAIYTDYLNLYPDSALSPKIKNRLQGLKTMGLEPRSRIDPVKRRSADSDWNINGALSLYYRNDVIKTVNEDREIVNSALVTDLNLIARHKTDSGTLMIRFDGGIYSAIEDAETDSRIGHALVSYTNSESGYQLTGGRQLHTAKGVYGRFDGLVYKKLSQQGYNFSIYTGFPAQSSYDDVQTDRRFIGTSVHFRPFSRLEIDIYYLQQDIFGLTDRQALGTEFEYRRGRSYLFGIIDYDLFYDDLNNFTAIGSFSYSDKLELNLSYDFRNSPTLTTSNALQGQMVESMEELKGLFSDEEIYQLAKDRTSKGQNLIIGTNYQIDNDHQLYLSISYASVEETIASGGVDAIPATKDLHFFADYSIRGFFHRDDYSSFGLRLSETASTNVISLRARTYFPGPGNLGYDPRLRLDYRKNHDTNVAQWILNPSIKLTYRASRKLNFEGSLGLEYSNFDLPEIDDRIAYSVLLGYLYQF